MRRYVTVALAAGLVGALAAAFGARAQGPGHAEECAAFAVPMYNHVGGGTGYVLGGIPAAFDLVDLPQGQVAGVVLPAGWTVVGGGDAYVVACR